MTDGWIKLHRRIGNHWLWPKGRRYSNLEAWIDLMLSANYQPGKVDTGSKVITIRRGQFMTSQVQLGRRWGWNRETVSRFLSKLKADEMLDIETSKESSTGYTLLTIRNYGKFQDTNEAASSIQSDIESSIEPASDQHLAGTIEEGKKKKKKYMRNAHGSSDGFDQFWERYPKKKDKTRAIKAWNRIHPDIELLKTILLAVDRQKHMPEWQKENGQYIPLPSTWLNGSRWEDELQDTAARQPKGMPL